MHIEDIYNKFAERVHNDKIEYDEGGKRWTNWCFNFFAEYGKNNGFRTFYERTPEEYLWDLVWSDGSEKTSYPQYIEMALEIEWGHYLEDIMYDFYKLLQCKSPLKIFICECPKGHKDEMLVQMRNAIVNMKIQVPFEQYLIINITRIHAHDYRIDGIIIGLNGEEKQLVRIEIIGLHNNFRHIVK